METIIEIYRSLVFLQRELNADLAVSLRGISESGQIPLALIGFGLSLGMIHALTPGHGKSVVLSYFLGRKARYGDGVAMAVKIATSHTLSAIILVMLFGGAVTLLGRPSGAAENLQTASYALIAAMGAYYLYRAIRDDASSGQSAHSHLLPVAVGILPCPLTMLVVGSAIAQGATIAGLLLAGVMGAGAAATIASVGLLTIFLRRIILARVDPANAWLAWVLRILEILSSTAILAIGGLFFVGRF